MIDYERSVLAVYRQLGRTDAIAGLSLDEGRENALARVKRYHQHDLLATRSSPSTGAASQPRGARDE
jgi:hypothetical protein